MNETLIPARFLATMAQLLAASLVYYSKVRVPCVTADMCSELADMCHACFTILCVEYMYEPSFGGVVMLLYYCFCCC